MTYRLLAGAEDDIDRLLLRRAGQWGVAGVERYYRLMLAVFALVGANPLITLKALSYFGEGTLRRLPRPVKDRLAAAARKVDLDQIPTIPRPRRPRR